MLFRLYYTNDWKSVSIYLRIYDNKEFSVMYSIQSTEISIFHRTSDPEKTGNSKSQIHKSSPLTGNAIPNFHNIIQLVETSACALHQLNEHVPLKTIIGNNEVLIHGR